MDSYKLKKIIIFISVITVNLIFVTMASVSIMKSITKQLKEEKNGTSISKNRNEKEERPEEQESKMIEEESSDGELSVDFNRIITYLKSSGSGKVLASLEILIGVNLVVVSILLLLRLRRNG